MQHDARPSRTAYRVAVRRAVHQIIDHPNVLHDPIAVAIVGADAVTNAVTNNAKSDRFPSLRAFVVARSRYAEDELAQSIRNGVTQYVVLGAGLDTFAYRNPFENLRVFEVDHPATQAWKREKLNVANIPIPSNLTFVPVNFEMETIRGGLQSAGFDASAKTFFSWLGVTPYLTREAFDATVHLVAAMPAGSGIAFDYTLARSSLNFQERMALDALSSRVASAGEPFQLFFETPRLVEDLRRAGFDHIEDLPPSEINARYFSNRADGLKISGGLAHLIGARV
jgi:methyltransferase (TIGR00027 family)